MTSTANRTAQVVTTAVSAFLTIGCAGGHVAESRMPPREVVWNSVQLETEACRRRLSGAVFSGPIQVTGTQIFKNAGVMTVEIAYEVPVSLSPFEGTLEGTLLPMRGEVIFLYEAGAWRVHERHVRHWRAAGLAVMPNKFFP